MPERARPSRPLYFLIRYTKLGQSHATWRRNARAATRARNYAAATRVQCAWRVFLACCVVDQLRAERDHAEMLARGKIHKQFTYLDPADPNTQANGYTMDQRVYFATLNELNAYCKVFREMGKRVCDMMLKCATRGPRPLT